MKKFKKESLIFKFYNCLMSLFIFFAALHCSSEEDESVKEIKEFEEVSYIQNKLNQAPLDEIILIEPGIYYENISYPQDKNITLRCNIKKFSCFDAAIKQDNFFKSCQSEIENTYLEEDGLCILDGRSLIDTNENKNLEDSSLTTKAVVTFTGGGKRAGTLDGFVIRNGFNKEGGGVAILNESNPKLMNLIIIDNYGLTGGGLYIENSNPELENVIISKNKASSGGGININNSKLNLRNIIISYNSADFGGTIFMDIYSNILETNLYIFENESKYGLKNEVID